MLCMQHPCPKHAIRLVTSIYLSSHMRCFHHYKQSLSLFFSFPLPVCSPSQSLSLSLSLSLTLISPFLFNLPWPELGCIWKQLLSTVLYEDKHSLQRLPGCHFLQIELLCCCVGTIFSPLKVSVIKLLYFHTVKCTLILLVNRILLAIKLLLELTSFTSHCVLNIKNDFLRFFACCTISLTEQPSCLDWVPLGLLTALSGNGLTVHQKNNEREKNGVKWL